MKKIILPAVLLIAVVLFGFIQPNEDWKLAYSNNSLTVSYKIIPCDNNSTVLLQLKNLTNSALTVSYVETITLGNADGTIETPNFPEKNLRLLPNQTLEGSCSTPNLQISEQKLGKKPGMTHIINVEILNVTIR